MSKKVGVKANLAVIAAYVAAGMVAAIVAATMLMGPAFGSDDLYTWLVILIADVAATVVVFGFSVAFNNSSLYDPYWSVVPPVIAGYYIFGLEGTDLHPAQWLLFAAVTFWAVRLTYNWYRQWGGLQHEDWRYIDLREKHGKAYWAVSFSGIHLFPTLLVYLGCLPMLPAFTTAEPNWLMLGGVVVTFAGGLIEAVADQQLHRFVQSQPPKGTIMQDGIWRYSRHPNYFGEMTFWWGIWLAGLAADPAYWWTVAGPLSITLLFIFISLPMIDKRHLKRRPHYREHMQKVSAFVPLPRRNA